MVGNDVLVKPTSGPLHKKRWEPLLSDLYALRCVGNGGQLRVLTAKIWNSRWFALCNAGS